MGAERLIDTPYEELFGVGSIAGSPVILLLLRRRRNAQVKLYVGIRCRLWIEAGVDAEVVVETGIRACQERAGRICGG